MMDIGDRVILKCRPVSGRGVVENITPSGMKVRLDDGDVVYGLESDLMLELTNTSKSWTIAPINRG